MISLTSKADFYENSSDSLKSFANPIQLQTNRRLSLFREMMLSKSTVFQHLARLKKDGHDFRDARQRKSGLQNGV